MDVLELVTAHENLDVLGESFKTMSEERHAVSDCIRYFQFIKSSRDPTQGLLNKALPLEVESSFV